MHDFVRRIEYCQSYCNEQKEIIYQELTCGFVIGMIVIGQLLLMLISCLASNNSKVISNNIYYMLVDISVVHILKNIWQIIDYDKIINKI